MKMLHYMRWHSALIILAGMPALSACVNEEYDLSKDIDTDLTVLKNISMPVGSIGSIAISDILTLDDDSDSVIRKDENGDFVFAFTGQTISAEIEAPSFSIAPSGGIHTEPMDIYFNTGDSAGLDPSNVSGNIIYSDVTGGLLDAPMDITIDEKLPEQIVDIRSVDIDASIYLSFSVNSGPVHLSKGFVIQFPEFLNISKNGFTDSRFEIIDNHRVVARSDVKITPNSPLTFSLKTDKVYVPDGAIVNGHLLLDDEVRVKGDIYLSPSDFTIIPDKLLVTIKADITDLDVISAEVKLNINETIAGNSLSISDLPEFLSDGNVCLDVYNPIIELGISNDTPFAFDVKAGIVAKKGTDEVSVKLGESQLLPIPANSTVNYHVSRREIPVTEGITNIVVPEIGDVISMLPETISFNDIRLSSTDKDFMTITTGNKYQAAVSYEVYAPLAFDKNLDIEFTQDINDIAFRMDDVILENIEISMNIENTIPLDFIFADLKAVDEEGNEIEGMVINVDNAIKAGSLDSPAITKTKLSLKRQGGSVEFDGLRLGLKAVAPSAGMYGIALNERQGLKISEIVLTVPEGITYVNDEN